ncbi:MAG TPA: hypothetical protein VKN99_08045 [Polyangia bacterium]|nr:hypothetical protein [Polyangia bacterium]
MRRVWRGGLAVLPAALMGCLEASGPAAPAPDAQPVCVLSVGACPAGCDVVPGFPIDRAAGCIRKNAPIPIGCAPPGTGAPRIDWCYTSADGTVVWAPYQYEFGLDPAWRDCSQALQSDLSRYPAC